MLLLGKITVLIDKSGVLSDVEQADDLTLLIIVGRPSIKTSRTDQ
jgi:hypothetical protein